MNAHLPDKAELLKLIDLVLSDSATMEQKRQLEASLLGDSGNRRLYLHYLNVHAALGRQLALVSEEEPPVVPEGIADRRPRRSMLKAKGQPMTEGLASTEQPGRSTSLPLLAWLFLIACLVAAFANTFWSMWIRWFPAWLSSDLGLYDRLVEGDSYYTHAPLVPIFSLAMSYLLVRYAKISIRPRPVLGGLVLALSLLVQLAACFVCFQFVQGFAFIGVVIGLVLLLWGANALRRLWFPIAMLFFMMPLPPMVIAEVNFKLKMLAADWGVAIASMLGFPAARFDATIFIGPVKEMVVGSVCSGLRTMISLVAIGAVYAYFSRLRGLWKLGLIAGIIPVAAIANLMRIVSLIIVAYLTNVKMATGWYHDFSGMMIFVLTFLMLFGLQRVVLRLRKAFGRSAAIPLRFQDVRRGPQDDQQSALLARAPASWRGLTAIVLLGLAIPGVWWLSRPPSSLRPAWSEQMLASGVPRQLQINGRTWDSSEVDPDPDYLFWPLWRTYGTGGAPAIEFLVALDHHSKGFPPPELYLEANGQYVVGKEDVAIDVSGRGQVFCRGFVVQSSSERRYYLYTCKNAQEYTPSFWRQQQSLIVDRLWDRNSGLALIRLSTPIDGDADQARQRCKAFLQAVIPYLDQALP